MKQTNPIHKQPQGTQRSIGGGSHGGLIKNMLILSLGLTLNESAVSALPQQDPIEKMEQPAEELIKEIPLETDIEDGEECVATHKHQYKQVKDRYSREPK